MECFKREGGLPVFAAGNYGNQWQTYPAAYQLGLIVTASNSLDERAEWTSHGIWTWPNGLAAPGDDVLVMIANIFMGDISFRYDLADGTSFSAPLVAALAANYWSVHPEMTNEEVMNALLESVYKPEDYPEVNPDPYTLPNYYGRGIVDAAALFGGERAGRCAPAKSRRGSTPESAGLPPGRRPSSCKESTGRPRGGWSLDPPCLLAPTGPPGFLDLK